MELINSINQLTIIIDYKLLTIKSHRIKNFSFSNVGLQAEKESTTIYSSFSVKFN